VKHKKKATYSNRTACNIIVSNEGQRDGEKTVQKSKEKSMSRLQWTIMKLYHWNQI
jgi:hypothetical protein